MLSPKDHDKVLQIIKTAVDARVIYRANALNLRQKGLSAAEIADYLEISSRTVFNIQKNYEDYGLDSALHDDPRPGKPPKFDDRTKAQIVALVCSDPPEGFDRWTLDLIQEYSKKNHLVDSIGRETIRVILREHDLKPWQQKSWCVPDLDEDFIERMEDVLEVYEQTRSIDYPLVCVDEKPIQLLEDIRPASGLSPGKIRKEDFEYMRKGTANVFCAIAPKTGLYFNKVTSRRCASDFAKFLASIERRYKEAKSITLVMDNLNTHKEKSLTDFYGEKEGKKIWDRFDVHYTPKHGSWLNQAEIAINMYARQALGKTRIPDIESLRKRTAAWNRAINRRNVTINWRFTRRKAREKFNYH